VLSFPGVNQEGEQSDIENKDDVRVLPKLIERSFSHLMLKLVPLMYSHLI